MILLKKQTANILGLTIDKNAIGWALIKDFWGTFPLIEHKKSKGNFFIHDRMYVVDNRDSDKSFQLIYKICFIENKKGFNELLELLTSSAKKNKHILYANDSNFNVAIVLDDLDIKDEEKKFYEQRINDALNYLIDEININPKSVIIEQD